MFEQIVSQSTARAPSGSRLHKSLDMSLRCVSVAVSVSFLTTNETRTMGWQSHRGFCGA
jgi:hypothetical protein